jgi:hypothetical protein
MPKNIEDIIPRNNNVPDRRGRSIRDVPIPSDRRRNINLVDSPAPPSSVKDVEAKYSSPTQQEPQVEREPAYRDLPSQRDRRSSPSKKIFLAVGAALVVIVLLVLSLTGGATLAYVPKSQSVTFPGNTYIASRSGDSGLTFSVVKLSGDKGIPVAATGEEDASVKASGKIVVYNNTSASQQLVTNTRFETPDGKLFRTREGITVPAKKLVGGVSQPGSVEVTVYADVAGPSHNIGLSDFTLPGLKGDPVKYREIYARSKAPMTGGFVGKMKKVSDENLKIARDSLQASLRDELISQTQAQVPEGLILFPSLTSIIYEDLPQSGATADSVTVNLRGNLYGVMFDKTDLATYLVAKQITLAPGEVVDIPTLSNLEVSYSGAIPGDLLKTNQISIKVSGVSNIVWQTDQSALRNDLVGRSKSEVAGVLKNYPSITSADAILRPFWKSSFPTDATEITIKEQPIK